MDHDRDLALERLFARASRSALASLDAAVDVEQCLLDLYRDVGHNRQTRSPTASTPEPPSPHDAA